MTPVVVSPSRPWPPAPPPLQGPVVAGSLPASPARTVADCLRRRIWGFVLPSRGGDAAYGELKSLLAGLHDAMSRRGVRVFLAGLRLRRRRVVFQRSRSCIRKLLFHDSRCGLPITTLASCSSSPAGMQISVFRGTSSVTNVCHFNCTCMKEGNFNKISFFTLHP